MEQNKAVFAVLAVNHPGVLLRVAGLFSRRGFNIDSIVACRTEKPEFSRLTLVVAIVFTVIVVALYVGQHADKTYENAFKDGLAKLEETINSEQSSSSGSDTSAAADTDAESGAGSASSESESASDSAQTAE